MKVTKEKLIHFNNALFEVSDLKGVKFAYAVSKNKKKLSEEMQAIDHAQKPSEDFIEYEKNLRELATKHAKRDEAGEIIHQKNEAGQIGIAIADDDVVFTKAKEALDKKYQKAIKEQEAINNKIQEILEEEVNLEVLNFHQVAISDLPEELTANQIEKLEFMIAE